MEDLLSSSQCYECEQNSCCMLRALSSYAMRNYSTSVLTRFFTVLSVSPPLRFVFGFFWAGLESFV